MLTSSVKSSISNIAERSGNRPEAKMNRTLAEMSKLYSKGRFSVRLAMKGCPYNIYNNKNSL
jgi:hypothetical protein